MTDQAPIAVPEAEVGQGEGPRLYGVIDVIKAERIAGWVIDRTDPAACAEVDLLREGRVVATQTANRPRRDLARNGVGTGLYGFSIPLDPPLEPGMEFTLSIVARSRDGVECPVGPTARLAGSRVQPEQKILERVFTEVTALRDDLAQNRKHVEEALEKQVERIEMVQMRIEAMLATVEPPEPKSQRGLWGLAGAGAVIAVISLAVGIWSLLAG
ncbi:hypothetical protein [Paenirhodobacter sp.]|uniref:hypothetical protein n=1 Tax=Paenirhodobacter sp. TaxID=1965326 RepID=UPI003B418C27